MTPEVLIPAKQSERVPDKNLRDWRGKPLILWSIEYARNEGFEPVVITPHEPIADYCNSCGVSVFPQPELRRPSATEAARAYMAASKKDLVILQPTSPLRRPGMILETIELLKTCDSVFSGARLPSHLIVDKQGNSVNREMISDGNLKFFPDSQTVADDPHFLVTGAVFGVSCPGFLELQSPTTMFGNVRVIEQPWNLVVDIDDEADFERPSVCVVGSSRSLRMRRFGWWIDEHDVVIRSNNFRTGPHAPYVGCKTTHWCLGCSQSICDRVNKHGPFNCSQFVEVWLNYLASAKLETVRKNLKSAKSITCIQSYDRLEAWRSDLSNCIPVPTTGLVAIAEALHRWGPPIDIAGYGLSHRTERGYYWEEKYDNVARVGDHDYEIERQLVNSWELQGLVRRIDA